MLQQALRETIRVQDGFLPLFSHHLARLAAGGCTSEILDAAHYAAQDAVTRWPHAYGRMALLVEADGTVSVQIVDRPSSISVPGGVVSVLVPTEVPRLPLGAAKPADRSFWDAALTAAQDKGGDLAVLVGPDGHLIDGSQATVWLRFEKRLLTPPSPPALAGVSRAVVFDVAADIGYTAEESLLTVDEFESAEEVIFTTALAGAVPARGRGGEASVRLAECFAQLFGT